MSSILAKKAVLAALSMSRWNGHRIDRRITDKVNKAEGAETDAGRYNKKLISTAAMAPVTSAITAARNYHYKMTLPWLDEGARILPSKLFLEYTEAMRDHRTTFETAADEFTEKYPGFIAEAQKRLGDMYDATDYPAVSAVRALFDFDVGIYPCPDTEDFRIAVGDEHAEDIRLDVARRMKDAMAEASVETMQRAAETIGKMAERLRAFKPGEKGAPATGTFRDSLVGNVRELAHLLPSFNLSSDPKIEAITKRVTEELCKHDPETLREDETARTATANAAEEILASVSDFIG